MKMGITLAIAIHIYEYTLTIMLGWYMPFFPISPEAEYKAAISQQADIICLFEIIGNDIIRRLLFNVCDALLKHFSH